MGYCLADCASDDDCKIGTCDEQLHTCATPSLRYDIGSPEIMQASDCMPLAEEVGGFGPPQQLSDAAEPYVFGPMVALDPVDAAIRYVAFNSAAGTDVSVSHDAGANWQRHAIATDDIAPNIGDPWLAVDAETREVWHSFMLAPQMTCMLDQTADSGNFIGLVSSSDLGRSWSDPSLVDAGEYAAGFFLDRPSVAVSQGAVFVVFVAVPAAARDPHTDVVLSRSFDHGQTWSVTRVSGAQRAVLRRAPTLSLATGSPIVAWFEKSDATARDGSVWVARSTDAGETFSEQQVSGELIATEDGPSLTASRDGSASFLIFGGSQSKGLSGEDVYLSRSLDGGESFDAPSLLAHGCGSAWSPAATVDAAGRLEVIWYQALAGSSQVAWLELEHPEMPDAVPRRGVLPGSSSPFTMSRRPLTSLGDFLGLASNATSTVAAWTSLRGAPGAGTAVFVSSE